MCSLENKMSAGAKMGLLLQLSRKEFTVLKLYKVSAFGVSHSIPSTLPHPSSPKMNTKTPLDWLLRKSVAGIVCLAAGKTTREKNLGKFPAAPTGVSDTHGSYLHYQVGSQPPALAMASASGTVPKGQALYPLSVKKYSNSFSLYTNPSTSETCQAPRPLLLFLPWMGSKAKSQEKYIQLYFKLGFDVFVAESSLSHFLWPRTGLEHARRLLDLLMEQEELSSRTLFVHAMSVGGYLFAQMLVCSSKQQRELLERVHGQVFDSLVVGSTERMATGVAQMVSSPLLEPLVVRGLLLYFSLLKGQTADYYQRGIQTFLEKPVHSPALFFYCLNDPLSDHVALEEFLQCWEKQGIKVQGKKWKHSVHAGHLGKHTEEYTDTLNSFISSLLNNAPRSRL